MALCVIGYGWKSMFYLQLHRCPLSCESSPRTELTRTTAVSTCSSECYRAQGPRTRHGLA